MVPLPSTLGEWAFYAVTLLLGGGFLATAIDWFRNRGKPKVEITAMISTAAAQAVEMLQKTANEAEADTRQARVEAKEASQAAHQARLEVEETREEMRSMRLEMATLAYRFRRLVGAILDDNVSREDLRRMAREPGLEGTD